MTNREVSDIIIKIKTEKGIILVKKIIACLLAALICLSLCSCGKTEKKEEEVPSVPEETEVAPPEEEEEEVVEKEPEKVTEGKYVHIDGLYVDNSYVDSDNANLKLLYVFYTLSTDDKNLSVDSKSLKIKINGMNEYESHHIPDVCLYMGNYYYSDYLEDVYIGSSLKVVETFLVPMGEFNEDRKITMSKHQVSGFNVIHMSTADVVFMDSVTEIAEQVDPEGYLEECDRRADADETSVKIVKKSVNGYRYSFYVNNMSYIIDFYAPNKFDISMSGFSNSGTYTVKKGYVYLNYPGAEEAVRIPYTIKNGEADLDIVKGFDVRDR